VASAALNSRRPQQLKRRISLPDNLLPLTDNKLARDPVPQGPPIGPASGPVQEPSREVIKPGMEHPPQRPAISSVECVPRVNFHAGDAKLWLALGSHAGLVGGYGAEQPVRLAVDPVGEVEDIGTPVVAPHPEPDRPQAARG